jgi:hypothetical protein
VRATQKIEITFSKRNVFTTPAREERDEKWMAEQSKKQQDKENNPDAVDVGEEHAVFLKDKGLWISSVDLLFSSKTRTLPIHKHFQVTIFTDTMILRLPSAPTLQPSI